MSEGFSLEEEACPHDEEGLLKNYDVVICGTGLIQSILASALTRAGKSVLHCDAQAYYGELDAVLTLPYIRCGELWGADSLAPESLQFGESYGQQLPIPKPRLRFHSTDILSDFVLTVGAAVETPYGYGVIKEISGEVERTVEITLSRWVLAQGTSPTLYVSIPAGNTLQSLETYLASQHGIRSSVLVQAERLLEHSSQSFAIDVTPSLIFGAGAAVVGFLTSNVSEYVEFKAIEGMLWLDGDHDLSRVPCSKGDVFATKLLNPLEKRKLMKFLQLVMDYATSEQATAELDDDQVSGEQEVLSLNERHLNQGRSLSRPQNKAIKADDLETLKQVVEANNVDFETYLRDNQKLSPSLTSLVRHALALETTESSISVGEGMKRLCSHLQGLGRWGKTAFLAPMYGSGELPQAFCRSAAVHGCTYLLRREPKSVQVVDNVVTGVTVSGVDASKEDKIIACDLAIVPPMERVGKAPRHLVRRVSIISGKIVTESEEQRHVILVPPKATFGNDNAVHGLVLDCSVRVAPPGCSLLHLTTVVEGTVDVSILERVVNALLPDDIVEIYHLAFSYILHEPIDPSQLPSGLVVCEQVGQTLSADDTFLAAKEMFEQICPGVEFLSLSREMKDVITKNMVGREEEDEEREVLDKAANMLDSTQQN